MVGGGFYSDFAALPVSQAWELFGQANGARTETDMRRRLAQYRRSGLRPDEDPVISCVFIRDTRFFPADDDAPPPPEFASNIVQGKSYDLAEPRWSAYFQTLPERVLQRQLPIDLAQPWHRDGPVYGDPRLSPQRLCQQAFKGVVLDAYYGRCAITNDKIRPVLQAAHIKPLPNGGEHRLDNGILLRSDVHNLYDRGYLGVDLQHRLLVSPQLRRQFGNGEQFYSKAGQPIAVPDRRNDRPHRLFLEWHLDTVFRAS